MDSYQAVYDAVRSRFGSCDAQAAIEAAANLQLGGLSYIRDHVQQEVYRVSEAMTLPHVLMRPAISIDGDHWCALYGENLQDGVAGFGKSPAEALADFDRNWSARLPAPLKPKRLREMAQDHTEALERIKALAAPGQELGISEAIDLICDIYNEAKSALAQSQTQEAA